MTRRLVCSTIVAVVLGAFLAAIPGPAHTAHAADLPPTFMLWWGTYGTRNDQFDAPDKVAVDTDGNVYVADTGNVRIKKFDANGTHLTQWGRAGSGGGGEFNVPADLAVDTDGNVYVADNGNNRIQKFDTNGTYLTKWGGVNPFNPSAVAVGGGAVYVADRDNHRIQKFDTNGTYLTQWGSVGAGDGQFRGPEGVAVDTDGNVYVADNGNNRIQKFDANGTYLTQWGSAGDAHGQFQEPRGLGIDSSGNVYVADTGNNRIQKFDANGTYLTQWGTTGAANGQFSGPRGVGIDSSGNVYVADTGNNRIQRFSTSGATAASVSIDKTAEEMEVGYGQPIHYHVAVANRGTVALHGVTVTDPHAPDCSVTLPDLAVGAESISDCSYTPTASDVGLYANTATVSTDETGVLTSNTVIVPVGTQPVPVPPTFVRTWGTGGTGTAQFQSPQGVAVDGAGHLYVTDTDNDRVQKFDLRGGFLGQWGTTGGGDGQFHAPDGIAVNADGDVYVADTYNNRIQKFGPDGTYLTQWGSTGSGDGQFQGPEGVGIDSSGNVYVADAANDRIQKFDANGTYLTQWGSAGGAHGQFRTPWGVAVDATDQVYVVDRFDDRIQVFDANGTWLRQWYTGNNSYYSQPRGVAVDPTNGNVYVALARSNRVEQYSSTGTYPLTQWGMSGTRNGQFRQPWGLAVDGTGNVYVVDKGNNRIQKFSHDVTAPAIDLRTPTDGQVIGKGTAVVADFSCADSSGIASCDGTVPDGSPIAADSLGDHTFTVTATDTVGRTATVTHHYTVVRASRLAGTVTEHGTGDPLRGTWVIALRTADYGLAGGALTGADGHYSLPVDAGTYAIEFVDPEFSHVVEWHDGHGYRDIEQADPVLAVAGATTTVDAALQDPTGAVEGIVTEAGTHTPLADSVVAVLPVGVPRPLAATTTDTDGDFRIDGLAPGDYLVVTAMPQGTHVATFYGGTSDVNAAVPVTVTAGSSSYAFLAPPPVTGAPAAGQVTGNVTDDVTGLPEPGALVGVLRAADFRFTAATFTDQDGNYSLGVGGGDHYLETFDLDTGHQFEWYDDQQTPHDWSELTTVFTSSTADTALTPLEGNVAGTVTETGTGTSLAGIWVALIGYDTGQPVAGTTTDSSGHYTLPAIDIGDYYQVFIDPTGNHTLEFEHDTGNMGAASRVAVTGSHTTTVDADLAPTS